MSKQVLGIFGATGCHNFGDYAMLINDIRTFYSINKNIKIKIFSYKVDNTRCNINNNLSDITDQLDIEVVPDLTDSSVDQCEFEKIWQETYNGDLSKVNSTFIKNINECDKIIFMGGGYINNNWRCKNITFMIAINCAKILGKSVYFLANTIGPLDEKYKNIVGESLQFVESIMIRDNSIFSEKILNDIGYKNIIKGPDDFFFVQPKYYNNIYNKSNYIVIELMLLIRRSKKGALYVLDELAKFMNFIIENEHKNVILVNFHKGDRDGDKFINMLYSLINNKDKVYIEKNIDDIYRINDMYQKCDFSLSFRYHPLVIALGNKKPCLGIITDTDGYYSSKFGGAISNLGLDIDELTMDIQELSYEYLKLKYENIKKGFKLNEDKYKELYDIRLRYIEQILK